MKIIYSVLLALSFGAVAQAADFYAPETSCATLQAEVQEQGFAAISDGTNVTVYQAEPFCETRAFARPTPNYAFVRAADNDRCFVGYVCRTF